MTKATCARCGEPPSGPFCSACGARTEAAPCPSCGTEAAPGDRFCTRCGASLASDASGEGAGPESGTSDATGRRGGSLAWAVAGALLTVVIVALALPRIGGNPDDAAPDEAAGEDLAPTSSVDLSSMTPREAADRLFERVIRAWEAGERAEAMRFQPMAVGAYERARPLDPDGHFHLAMLHMVAGEWEAVLEAAEAGLEQEPAHLLNLAIAAEAHGALGDTAEARRHHERFLEHYDREVASDHPDYEAHRALVENMRESALEATGGGDG